MSYTIEKMNLKSPSPGTRRFLTVYKFKGNRPGPKVYLQAALHADEWPGLLTLQHLLEKLIELDAQDKIMGEIVVVPYANPIGMDQKINGKVLGRHSFSCEGNFNRHWPDLSFVTQDLLDNALQTNQTVTVSGIKTALLSAVAELPTQTPLNQLKATLLSLSMDADFILDLHCDSDALVHVYSNYRHQQQCMVLAQCMQSPVVLLEDEPGGSPFDAAHILPWIAAEKVGVEFSCFSATVELRGETDVTDELAAIDAQGLLLFLISQKVIDLPYEPLKSIETEVTDLTALDAVIAPSTGIIAWKVALGARVEKGQLIAEIVNIEAEQPNKEREAVYSRSSGVLFARPSERLVSEGDNIAKITGTENLQNLTTGGLLSL